MSFFTNRLWRKFFFVMQFQLFEIPVGDAVALEHFNRFLRGNKILQTDKHFVATSNGALWYFCVAYMQGAVTATNNREKKDYKSILDEKTFEKFSLLRKIRKNVAVENGVPAYAIFTDEELVSIASLQLLSAASIKTIKGIGEKKAEKYGEVLAIEFLKQMELETNKS